jgi:hypothetical protein
MGVEILFSFSSLNQIFFAGKSRIDFSVVTWNSRMKLGISGLSLMHSFPRSGIGTVHQDLR